MLSIEKKLPLLIGGLVAAVVVIASSIAVTQVRTSAREAAADRLERIGHEMADLVETALPNFRAAVGRAAAAPEVVAFAAGSLADSAAAFETLNRLRTAQDSGYIIQVLDRDGALLGMAPQLTREQPILPAPGRLPEGIGAPTAENGRGFYWLEAPITRGRDTIGWVRQQRALGGPNAREQFQNFLGDNIGIHFGDRAGGEWVSLAGTVGPPSATDDRETRAEFERGGTQYLAHIDTVAGMPWSVIAELDHGTIYARASTVLRDLMITGIVLLLLGGLAAWAISRQVTRPLRELGRAADALAHGDYDRRAQIDRDDELGRLSSSFNSMADRIARSHEELALASQSKSEFLATMSHEIRTPINAVIGYADLLEAGTAGDLEEKQRVYLDRIRASGRHLTELVNEVLDFSKIEAGVMSLHPGVHGTRSAVQSAVGLLASSAAHKGVRLTVTDAPELTFFADAQRVHQILLNLLSNAVKFTPASGDVIVRWSPAEPADGDASPRIRIDVQDTGVGIAAEHHERIFEPFVQASSGYTREHGGTGLGLAISRRMARLMGGDVTVVSHPGDGSTFSLLLPSGTRA